MANPPIDISKRAQAEKVLYDFMDKADPTGANTTKYKKMFATMSDARFKQFMNQMFDDFNMNYILEIQDYKRHIDIELAEKALAVIGVPADEHLVMPYLNMDVNHPIVTKYKVVTGYIIDMRLQQTNHKKNSTSIHIAERSATTGQVVGNDKNGRSSDQENIALTVLGADKIAAELNGFRADGLARKNEAYADIAKTGVCSLDKVEANHGIEDRTALNTLDVFYTSLGIKTDLVSPDYIFVSTARKGGASDDNI
jgi:hypothetical protein